MLDWLSEAKRLPSPYFNERPPGQAGEPSLLVIHCISLPEGQFGTPYVKQLFCGELDCQTEPSLADLEGLEVSAHLVIRRDGALEQYVSFFDRAWHAGISSFAGREGCNDFSIGIELEGTDSSPYTDAQYLALAKVSKQLMVAFPQITQQRIVGHSDIAPGRKTDPGSCFDWPRYKAML